MELSIILSRGRKLKSVFFERGIGILPKIGLVTDLSFLVNGLLPVDKKIKLCKVQVKILPKFH